MKSAARSLVAVAAGIVATACSTAGGASPPHRDQEDGAGAPMFQPMLVVPLPPLDGDATAAGRPMEALQSRGTPLSDVLLALFKDSDINLVVDPTVQAIECTFDIKKSTVEEAFEALLATFDLGYEWDGTFLRVKPMVEATIGVDLMAGAAQTAGGSTSSESAASSTGGSAQADDFWQQLEQSLPQVLGEGATFVVNKAASAVHVTARPSGVRRLAEKYGYGAEAAEAAPWRVVAILRMLAAQLDRQRLAGRPFLVGSHLTALDIYWATFAAMLEPLPEEQCPMPAGMRMLYTASGPVRDALDPALLAHRDFVYREYLQLPVDCSDDR